jgi:hypothetical protein
MLVLVPCKHCAAQAHLQLHKVCVTGDVFGLLGVVWPDRVENPL